MLDTVSLEAFGHDVRDRRRELGLSVRALAARAGVSPAYVTAIERGRNPATGRPAVPSVAVLVGLAAALELEVARLLDSLRLPGTRAAGHVLLYSCDDRACPLGASENLFGDRVDHWLCIADPRGDQPALPGGRATVRRWQLGEFPYDGPRLVPGQLVSALELEARELARAHAGHRVGLLIADCSAVMRRVQNAEAEVALERRWDAEVHRIWAEHLHGPPAVDVCFYRHADVEALGLSIDQLATALELVRQHDLVILLDGDDTVTGPPAVRRILERARPVGVGAGPWRELVSAAAAGLAGAGASS
ncbi:MAG: helix-turn-helix domain-containing protein [Thermoleophilia bacterium]|nr:helix-turn-helix domain-containing protein [Thermoleophilia bacterium]